MSAPLVPPECDLSGLRFMPLDAARLLDSDLMALSTGDEFKAAVALWCKAWGQVPSGSLTNDERVLARAAGVSLAEWRGLREMALRGWVECSDGRLYHPVVCEKVLEAWIERLAHRKRSASGNAAKAGVPFDPTPFDEAKARAVALLERVASAATDALADSRLRQGAESEPSRPASGAFKEPSRPENGSEEEVGVGDKVGGGGARVPSRVAWDRARLDELVSRLRSAAGPALSVDPMLCSPSDVLALIEPKEGEPCDLELDVLPAVAAAAATAKPGSVRRWSYFRRPILDARDRRLTVAPAPTETTHDRSDRPSRQQTARDDRLRRMLEGAVEAADGA